MHRISLALLALVLTSGCAHHQQHSCEERCSKQAMVCGKADSCASPGGDQQYRQIVKARSAADVKDAFNKKADQENIITVIIGALLFIGLGIISQ